MLKTFTKKLLKKNVSRWIVLAIDLYIVLNTFILAYFVRFNFQSNFNFSKVISQLPIVLFASFLGFIILGSYKGIIRHTGVKDAMNVFFASCFAVVILGFFIVLNREFIRVEDFNIPLSILVIHFLLNVLILIAGRFIFKTLYRMLIFDEKLKKNILIYGAGESGLITQSVLLRDTRNLTRIIGFIDDDKGKCKRLINGQKVFHSSEIDSLFIEKKNIEEIIISIQNIKTARIVEIVNDLSGLPLGLKIVPPVKDWINNNLKANQIKNIEIENLLGREPIQLNNPKLKFELNNKVIFITGAAGSIGSEIAKQISIFDYQQIVLIDQAESPLYNLQQYFIQQNKERITAVVGDVKDKKRMEVLFKQYKPNFIFHAAAYKHVPFMEENPYEAISVNVRGTKVIADLALKYKSEKFIMISTDKAVNPTNIMGATKRIAELYVNCNFNKNNTKFIIMRFGNVLGSNGSVIPLFRSQIKNGGPLTVTHKDITRYFMTIPEACQLVLEAGVMGSGGEIFVFDMGKSVKIFDLAKNMIRLSGFDYPKDIDIKITGLRPGEKIYEELLADGENTIPTHHEKILIARVCPIDEQDVLLKIGELLANNYPDNFENSVEKMKELLPEFISNNSEYERFDKQNIKVTV